MPQDKDATHADPCCTATPRTRSGGRSAAPRPRRLRGAAGPCRQPQPAGPRPARRPQPLPPVSAVALVWQPAHYDWTGATYQYVAGRYIAQAGHTRWADGWWSLDGARWVWVPAHWAG